jgi:tRNA(Arg) A34 adenosine deaminase TadA
MALLHSRVRRVVFGAPNESFGGMRNRHHLLVCLVVAKCVCLDNKTKHEQ